MGQTGFCEYLQSLEGFSAKISGFLRKSAPLKCCDSNRKSAKICENLWKETANLVPFVPFSLSLLFPLERLPMRMQPASQTSALQQPLSVTLLADHDEMCHPHGWSTWRPADQPTTRRFTWTWGLFKENHARSLCGSACCGLVLVCASPCGSPMCVAHFETSIENLGPDKVFQECVFPSFAQARVRLNSPPSPPPARKHCENDSPRIASCNFSGAIMAKMRVMATKISRSCHNR